MDKFIWISGSINSGKSTIAKLLSDKIPNGINIELDLLSHFDNKLSIENKANFIIQDALDLARNWLNRNRLPILNWPIWGEGSEFMIAYAKQLKIEPVIINLIPNIEIVKTNRGERELTEWELNRIDYMHQTGNINNPAYGFCIDNGHLTPDETVEIIIRTLKSEYAFDLNIAGPALQ